MPPYVLSSVSSMKGRDSYELVGGILGTVAASFNGKLIHYRKFQGAGEESEEERGPYVFYKHLRDMDPPSLLLICLGEKKSSCNKALFRAECQIKGGFSRMKQFCGPLKDLDPKSKKMMQGLAKLVD
jgi:hypothetical protein